MKQDVADRLLKALPAVRRWIERLCQQHRPEGQAVSTLGWDRLARCFEPSLLERARLVTVPSMPYPPLERLGLPELAPAGRREFAGITFQDTIFARRGQVSESLLFHELIHVLQWEWLGADGFLLAYGLGLVRYGYEENPFEQTAYSLQRRFEEDRLPGNFQRAVRRNAEAIRSDLQEAAGLPELAG